MGKVPIQSTEKSGIAFNTTILLPITNVACIEQSRKAFGRLADNPGDITSYSWRRMLPRVGMAVNYSTPEMIALGVKLVSH